jgi:hypothetical protein
MMGRNRRWFVLHQLIVFAWCGNEVHRDRTWHMPCQSETRPDTKMKLRSDEKITNHWKSKFVILRLKGKAISFFFLQ